VATASRYIYHDHSDSCVLGGLAGLCTAQSFLRANAATAFSAS